MRVGLKLRPDDEKELSDSLSELYGGEGYSRINRNHSSNINFEEFIAGLIATLNSVTQTSGLIEKYIHDINIIMKESDRTLEEVTILIETMEDDDD